MALVPNLSDLLATLGDDSDAAELASVFEAATTEEARTQLKRIVAAWETATRAQQVPDGQPT